MPDELAATYMKDESEKSKEPSVVQGKAGEDDSILNSSRLLIYNS